MNCEPAREDGGRLIQRDLGRGAVFVRDNSTGCAGTTELTKLGVFFFFLL